MTSAAAHTRRAGALILTAAAIALSLPSMANADLRSPHLTTTCQQGRPYEEHKTGPWQIEGCTETATPQGNEGSRRNYYGDVELNGMIVEGSGGGDSPLIVTTTPDGSQRVNRVQRTGAKLVLDPKIGGSRRRIVIFSGNLDLKIRTDIPGASGPNDVPHPRVRGAIQAAPQGSTGSVDIPVTGTPSLLGLRVRDKIMDAAVRAGDDHTPGSIEFKPPVSLGSTASALLRDWTAKINLKTVDGTGMTVDSLLFKVPNIEIPGIGGFKNLSLSYSAARDEWSGTIFLDLGDALFSLDLEMTVSASTGAPTRIAGSVGNLNIPVGNTGIFLQKVSALFNNNPLTMGVGADATAGPKFGNFSLVEIGGNLEMQLEPGFRLEASGSARVFPTDANSQLAKGSMHVIIDSDGYISIGGKASYSLVFEPLDLGASVDIDGSGAYSSTSNVFDIEANATGTAHLWVFGDVDVISFSAAVSSNGWGFCGGLGGFLSFIAAGIGQEWDRNPVPLLGCNLSNFEANVPDPHKVGGARHKVETSNGTGTFTLPRGVKTLAVEMTASGPEPKLTVTGPRRKLVANTDPTGTRPVPGGGVVAPPGSNLQYLFLRNPAAGRYAISSDPGAPALTGVRLARDIEPLKAKVSVARVKGHPGRRHLVVKGITGRSPSESVTIGVKTPAGILPLGSAEGSGFSGDYDELGTGARTVVAGIERNGVPIPGRSRVIAHFKATMPDAPGSVSAKLKGKQVLALAHPKHAAEVPSAWQYVLRVHGRPVALRRGKPGTPVHFPVDAGATHLTITVRAVVAGRALRGKAKSVAVR
jgi:hypothetical protein